MVELERKRKVGVPTISQAQALAIESKRLGYFKRQEDNSKENQPQRGYRGSPTKTSLITLNRSPHGNKTAREQFAYKRDKVSQVRRHEVLRVDAKQWRQDLRQTEDNIVGIIYRISKVLGINILYIELQLMTSEIKLM